MRRGLIAASVLGLGLLAAGCGTDIDVKATSAQLVNGTPNMYRFCDGPVLIYFSKWKGENDNYEAFFMNGCQFQDNAWVPAIAAPVPDLPEDQTDPSKGPGPSPSATASPSSVPAQPAEDDTNQQNERDDTN